MVFISHKDLNSYSDKPCGRLLPYESSIFPTPQASFPVFHVGTLHIQNAFHRIPRLALEDLC